MIRIDTQNYNARITTHEYYHEAMRILDYFNQTTFMDQETDTSDAVLQRAIGYLEKAIEVDPVYPGAYLIRAKIHLSEHEWDEAIAGFSKAIELDPLFFDEYFIVGDAQYLRGLAHYRSFNFKEAWKDFAAAAELGHEEAKQTFQKLFTEEDRDLFDIGDEYG